MIEDLVGRGEVKNAKSGAAVASGVEYALRVQHPRVGQLGHIDAEIGLDGMLAQNLIIANDKLTLTLDDGREVDFIVQAVSGLGDDVRVVATGGLRPATSKA